MDQPMRQQPSPAANRLWAALRHAGNKGITSTEAESQKLASESYARRRLSLWHAAGYLTRRDRQAAVDPHRYFLSESAPKLPPMITADDRVLDQTPAMSAAQFVTCRQKMGLSAAEMGRRLGLKGLSRDLSRAIRRFETGKKTIDVNMAEKVRALVVAHDGSD
ncbi:helix-turn-helix domain-containing protein [Neoaquamicrobium sediminum]|uniref:helix-turn-helix domain-containing protein n=1 Tax=Neoaquamicrobium sediminum TaxID=1849104 RepID=UPI0015633EE8|nr:helix-turn-helix transcriptional regulator [Mesorhizobium sediminum]NRC56219.1 helix-turn-helix transcriptional regulator [Mesorhizobium sediminum]